MTASATVTQGRATNLIVQVNNNFLVSKLTEAVDRDLSGTVGPWGQLEMLLPNGNASLYAGEPVYIQTIYYPVGFACSNCKVNPFLPYESTLALVTQVTRTPGGYWAFLSPRSLIDLQNISGAWIVLVSSSYRVVQGV
jgi:hypothetical protein